MAKPLPLSERQWIGRREIEKLTGNGFDAEWIRLTTWQRIQRRRLGALLLQQDRLRRPEIYR